MKAWLIMDGRGWTDPDDAAVYESFYEGSGDTRESVLAHRDEEWPDGVVYEYDEIRKADGKDWLENETLIG